MDQESLFHSLFFLLFIVTLALRLFYWKLAYGKSEPISRVQSEGAPLFILRTILGYSCVVVALLYLFNPEYVSSLSMPVPPTVRWLGALIALIGIVLLWLVHHHLGKNFTDTTHIRTSNRLVESGPYKYVRHPMYGAGLLLFLGFGTLAANWYMILSGTLMMFVVMMLRTPMEEQNLLKKHGNAYRSYMQRTGKFFPRLW